MPSEQHACYAVIYCRISRDREGRATGTARQERQCRDLAEKRGYEVVKVFVDDDTSATTGKARPGYEEMLTCLRDGRATVALALAPTRFYRSLRDGLSFFQLITEKRLHVETVKQGRYDLSTADGRRDALRAAVDAQYEAELIGERVRDAKADNAAAGEYRGGPRPFGYEADGVTIRESEAQWIRAAAERVLAGDSLRSIARDWKEAGIRTAARARRLPDGTRSEPVDKPWTGEELRDMLLRARNAGLVEQIDRGASGPRRGAKARKVLGPAQWPAIVPEDEWRQVRAVLQDPRRKTTTNNARKWLGSGLFRCGADGCDQTARVTSTTRGTGEKKRRTMAYRCRSGKHVTRIAEPLDAMVEAAAVARLARPDAAQLLLPAVDHQERQEAEARVWELRERLDTFAADYADGLISRSQMLAGTERTRAHLADAEDRLEALSSVSVLASLPLGTDQVETKWDGLDLSRKRAIVDALMTVTLLPAKRGRPKGYDASQEAGTYFDPESVRIDWKHSAH
ncbi:recombinase family protein [Streptomyces sp. BH106]|uniref:recombinase family protein n=1 Tax=Streptomyces sp. BH106 TaxID=3410409 RepID=UPI003CF59606